MAILVFILTLVAAIVLINLAKKLKTPWRGWGIFACVLFFAWFYFGAIDGGISPYQYCAYPWIKKFTPYLNGYGQLGLAAAKNTGNALNGVNKSNAVADYQRKGPYHVFPVKLIERRGRLRCVIDPIYFNLPAKLRAKNPDEVDTVVTIYYYDSKVGTYTDHADACQRWARVTVVDKMTGEKVDLTEISGSAPPPTKRYRGGARGSSPNGEIVKYLADLLAHNKK